MLVNLALNHEVLVERPASPASVLERVQLEETALLLNPSAVSSGVTQVRVSDFGSSHLKYNASSPDELALVNGARFLGVTYLGRDSSNNNLMKISVKGEERTYELLNIIQFSSARKRMTSVLRETGTGRILVMCKGADSVLLPLLANTAAPRVRQLTARTVDCMNSFAREGLRTLLIVEKTLSQDEYESWNAEFTDAMNSILDREAKVERCAQLLERDFELVGSTGLEDKLQDGVADTVEMIRRAGVKLWVLTGDKTETAVNIGYASSLLDDKMN